ncbi:mechanosensitive ion channel [Sulfitobacter sp. M220]|jgi:small-conductance mechanosensitive channel|uniref:mechanosensitive ion channel family protein n=1 Tax=Sulfitobacter TaxID=60136 RepID=UPI001F2E7890|nr:mechanosensitive ion channel family protein [Sulfitobacter sp. M220]MCF7778181.1 mechanosensitive ion channel [Sulfitobacter sp. M220]
MRHFIFTLLMSLWFIPLANASMAQGVLSLLPKAQEKAASDTDTDAVRLQEVIRQAAESGVSVVVVDSAGGLLNQPAPARTGEGAQPEDALATDASPLMHLQERGNQFRTALIKRIVQLPDAINEVVYILRAASPDGTLWAFGKTLLIALALFAVGVVVEVEVFGKRIARRFVTAKVQEAPVGYAEKMPFLVFRFFMGIIGVLVSMLVAYVLGALLFGPLEDTAIQFTATLINIGYFVCRVAAGLWRMILSPFLMQYRIPVFSDRDAKRLHRWLWIMASLDTCAILFGIWIGELGLNYDVYAFIASLMSAAIVVANILMIWVNRRAISNALRQGKPASECSAVGRFMSRAWAPLVVAYALFAWVELTYDLVLENPSSVPLIAGAYGILVSIIVVYGVINYAIERGFARARMMRRLNALRREKQAGILPDDGDAIAADITGADGTNALDAAAEQAALTSRQSLTSFESLARRVAGILAFVSGAYAFFYIWDTEATVMVESHADKLLDVMVILFIGYVVYHAFRIWIDSKIEAETADQPEAELGDEGSGASSASRLATLLPLFRNFVLIVLIVTIALIVLMEFGINVGPLFAGAGIVGVAVGFGSQALVRDIFAGAFFLFDDAFRKGEYLDVGGVKGTVEKISVRSFQLRHHLGALHTIPFGELQVMTNYSRDWVIMKLPLRVTYDTDVERVRKLIKKLGIELLDDPVIGDNFIQPLKSQGVIEMQDSAMIIRVKFMTKPGDQWLVRKKVYEEIRALFEREGIRFAHREVTVRLADGKVQDLSDEERNAVTAAAQASMEEEAEASPVQSEDDR